MGKLRVTRETGFGLVEVVLILTLVGLIGFVGWAVWEANYPPATPLATSQNIQVTNGTPEETPKDTTQYIDIKEWHVRFPLTKGDGGLYHVMRKGDEGNRYAEFFDKNFDTTKNADGVLCKDPTFPIFIISRVTGAELSDMDGVLKGGFSKRSDGYYYAGVPSSQAPPDCYDLEGKEYPDNIDDRVMTKFEASKQKLIDLYDRLEVY